MKHFNYNLNSSIFKDRIFISLEIEEVREDVNYEAEKDHYPGIKEKVPEGQKEGKDGYPR